LALEILAQDTQGSQEMVHPLLAWIVPHSHANDDPLFAEALVNYQFLSLPWSHILSSLWKALPPGHRSLLRRTGYRQPAFLEVLDYLLQIANSKAQPGRLVSRAGVVRQRVDF
jgi:hypothetical protein